MVPRSAPMMPPTWKRPATTRSPNGIIARRFELGVEIIEVIAAVQREFRRQAAGQAEPAAGVEEVVGLVPGDDAGERQDEIGAGRVDGRRAVVLLRRQQLHADRIGHRLLPDDVRFAVDDAGNADGLGGIGGLLRRRQAGQQVQRLVAPAEVAPPHLDAEGLFALRRDAADGQRAFGFPEVAVRPAAFEAEALIGRIAGAGGDGAHRRCLGGDDKIDDLSAIGARWACGLGLDGDAAEQPGLHQRAPEIDAAGLGIGVAGLETRQHGDMGIAEALRIAFDADAAEHARWRRDRRFAPALRCGFHGRW